MKISIVYSIIVALLTIDATNAFFLPGCSFGDLFDLILGKLNFSCETPTPVCLGICVYAEIYAGFNLLAPFFGGDPFLAAGFCLYPEVFGTPATPVELCIEVISTEIIGFDEGGQVLGGKGMACTATAAKSKDAEKEECNSCFYCADGGITFDCTNVAEGMIASTCQSVGVKLPTGFFEVISSADAASEEAQYPQLDG